MASTGSTAVPDMARQQQCETSLHRQEQSPFFSRLPPEIRHQIYEALLQTAGITQHIYKSAVGHSAAITHTRCHVDPDAEDVREKSYFATFPGEGEEEDDSPFAHQQRKYNQKVWRGRQYTDWCNHFICEETVVDSNEQQFSTILGPLLTSKRMHDEFAPVVYSSVTFSFINIPALKRFVNTTAPAHLAMVRSIHLIWCASMDAHDDQDDDVSVGDQDPLDGYEGLDSIFPWTRIWRHLSVSAPRLNRVRIWIYGRFPRFPMPAPEYFQVLEDFALGRIGGGPPGKERVMEEFTVQTVWTREFGPVVADGTELGEDHGDVVPDWLRGRAFSVRRVPAVEYEPEAWMAMYARPADVGTGGQGLGAILKGKGWGVRGRVVEFEGEEGFARH